MMRKDAVSVMFDRRKKLNKKGCGKVELCIYFSRTERRFISLDNVTPEEWLQKKDSYNDAKVRMENVLKAMEMLGEEITYENFRKNAGLEPIERKQTKVSQDYQSETVSVPQPQVASNTQVKTDSQDSSFNQHIYRGVNQKQSFLNYMYDFIMNDKGCQGTIKHKKCSYEALRTFGKIKTFEDLTPANILAFDRWLDNGTRTRPSIYTYHKHLKTCIRKLHMEEMIPSNPYDRLDIKKGKCKERQPLNESELTKLRQTELTGYLEKARNLFVFSAYTGLAYCDVMNFDYKTMTEKIDGMDYIVGERLKTGNAFYTPILPPALEILKKYDYQLPKISNQKANMYLHLLEDKCEIRKKITFHVARHSFATLALAHDIPIENVAKMLGHSDIKTTQIYAKVLNSTIERHAVSLAKAIV